VEGDWARQKMDVEEGLQKEEGQKVGMRVTLYAQQESYCPYFTIPACLHETES